MTTLTLFLGRRLVLEDLRIVLAASFAPRNHLPHVVDRLIHLFLKGGLALRDPDGVESVHLAAQLGCQCGDLKSGASAELRLDLFVEKFGHGRAIGGRTESLSLIQ